MKRFRRSIREHELVAVGEVVIQVKRLTGKGNRLLLCVDRPADKTLLATVIQKPAANQ